MGYGSVPPLVVQGLVWSNLSWDNISSSIVNQSTTSIVDIVNREATHPQLWFRRGLWRNSYIDFGAEETFDNVEAHIFLRPSSNKISIIRNYKRDMLRLIEEVRRVVRQNRTNASGYEFMNIETIVPLSVEDNPNIIPPYLETMIKIRLKKMREALT